jgi:hypothetical protein
MSTPTRARDFLAQCIRAQASAETLVVFLIFLSVFAIAASAAYRTGAAAQSRAELLLSQNSFSELSEKIGEACLLGPGNVRTISLARGNATLAASGKEFLFTSGNFKAAGRSGCEISVAQASPSTAFRIENIGGKIEIS